jgi:hypothetical protein
MNALRSTQVCFISLQMRQRFYKHRNSSYSTVVSQASQSSTEPNTHHHFPSLHNLSIISEDYLLFIANFQQIPPFENHSFHYIRTSSCLLEMFLSVSPSRMRAKKVHRLNFRQINLSTTQTVTFPLPLPPHSNDKLRKFYLYLEHLVTCDCSITNATFNCTIEQREKLCQLCKLANTNGDDIFAYLSLHKGLL